MKSKEYDFLIVGAGILGIAHAYHILQMGYSVALLDKNPYCDDASVRNFGQIVPSGFGSKWQNYGRKSLEIYSEIQSKIDITIRQTGSLYLASTIGESQLLSELYEINKKNNYQSKLISKSEIERNYPSVKDSYPIAGLYFPQEMNIDPFLGLRKIISFLQENHQLHYFGNVLITDLDIKNNKVHAYTGSQRVISGSQAIVCNGTDFKLLFPDTFMASPLEIVKLQMMETFPQEKCNIKGSILTGSTIKRYESFRECPSYQKIIKAEKQEKYAQEWGVHLLFKQNLDKSVIIGDSHEYFNVSEFSNGHFYTNGQLNNYIIDKAKEIIDLKNWQIKRSWLGFYSQCTNADIFYHEIDDQIRIVTGIGGKGMTASFGYVQENFDNYFSQSKQINHD